MFELIDNISKLGKRIVLSMFPKHKDTIKKIYQVTFSAVFSRNLKTLALIHGTDKQGTHNYTEHYYKHFLPLRRKRLKILEIGVGGYEDETAGGDSLRMWKYFFPNSDIYGIDIINKSKLEESRIKLFQGSQSDLKFLEKVVEEMGRVDIIVDDGSHKNDHVITSFMVLFPKLSNGGIYVIEDTQTSYWPKFGGDSYDLENESTVMGYFKRLVDGLNHAENAREGFQSSYFDQHIIEICFYHNQIFIYKGNNDGRSNYVHRHRY